MPTELFKDIPPQLHQLLDNYWQDWLAACDKEGVDPASVPLSETGKTWACSDFVARNCIRYPVMFLQLLDEGMSDARTLATYRQQVAGVFDGADNDESLMRSLRALRQREMSRIAWRDLNALASMDVILQELTDFAEAVVAVSLERLQQQQAEINGMPQDENGEPMWLLTFAMGKMGGGELNFSSDIDLIFAYPEDGETTGPRKVSHYEFYLAVIRKLVKVLDEVTVDGFVFRVDTRLRPFGESGPLAMSFSGMEQYYQIQGRDWERYAMIKAKLITGREQDKQYLREMLTPFIYRRYLDFSMLEEIRGMKAMINAQMQRKRVVNNIKLGPGGIREIEFIAQTLQLIRAGREPELQQRSLIRVLNLLAEKSHLDKTEVEQLITAYWFLRRLENRLQMLADKQTHVLPTDEQSQQRICLAMDMDSWEQLLGELAQHQQHVDRVFQQLVALDNASVPETASAFDLFWQNAELAADLVSWLQTLGFADTEKISRTLLELRRSPQIRHLNSDTSRKMAQVVQSMLQQLPEVDAADQVMVLDRISRILRALAGRRVYISLLNEYPQVQRQMIRLCRTSEWFTERLTRHPILLDGLLVSADILRQQHDVRHLLALELERVGDDLEQQMERMRQFRHQMVFNVALLDVFYAEPVETVSDRLTELANALLERILQLAWQSLVDKHGVPGCVVEGELQQPGMAIVAYGKLGGNELGYDSDLDIIFLHNSSGEKQFTAGDAEGGRVLDNQQFFARVAQRVIHFLNTRTYSGILYEADTRLRPDGQAGLMVSSIAAFESYQQEKAWTWEHQALIRARFVTEVGVSPDGEKSSGMSAAGARIEPEFDRIRTQVLRRPRQRDELLAEVVKMREKMRQHLAGKADGFDIKQDAGGLVDIEFMTQAGVLLYAQDCAECLEHTATLELIKVLVGNGWYRAEEADALAAAYRYFRRLKNWRNLKCRADESEVGQHREKVIAVWQRLMPEKRSLQL